MPTEGRGLRLRGRDNECNSLRTLLSSVQSSSSQVIVLRGEAGVGKTALLDYAVEQSTGFRVARVAGVESDMELAFAGLQQLCAPLLNRLDELPEPQREALNVAFGRGVGATPDRFLVGLAVLSLMASAADEQPLLCIIDDAQWLDQVSVQTLGFVARRLMAEPVAVLFSVRNGGADVLAGLPELEIRGLSDGDARELLDSVVLGRIDERVRDRIVAETRGIPLALLEVPRNVSEAELAGGFGAAGGRPSAGQIEDGFVRRIQSLPEPTRRLLLVAAAEPVGDAALFLRAAAQLGIPVDALGPAEAAGVIEFGPRMRFHHPLIRSAVYRAADLTERRAIHRALADATDPQSDPDRRAWHAANAAAGPDDAVAAELEASAGRAQSRGGIAAAATFLGARNRIDIGPGPAGCQGVRGRAGQTGRGGTGGGARTACDSRTRAIDGTPAGPRGAAARSDGVRPQPRQARPVRRAQRNGAATARRRQTSSRTSTTIRPARPISRRLRPSCMRGDSVNPTHCRMRPRRRAPRLAGCRTDRPIDLLLNGMAERITGGVSAGSVALRTALELHVPEAQRTRARCGAGWCPRSRSCRNPPHMNYGTKRSWTNCPPPWCDKRATPAHWPDFRGRWSTGRASTLLAGEFATATTLIEEANSITAATDYYGSVRYHSVLLAAWRGVPAEAVGLIEAVAADGIAKGEGRLLGLTGYASAVLYNGLGRYEEAFEAARRACEHEDLGFHGWRLFELIEAASRCGEHDEAALAVHRLEQRAGASGTDWGLGVMASARALLADDDHADSLYTQAIEHLERTRVVVHLARTRLAYGEWLRRAHHRLDARRHLTEAYEMFTRMGAQAFAERARRELIATGEKTRRQPVTSGDQLTAQEAQIARLAGDGLTNQEIGAQLFISTHTVEWHLRKVFVKLGVRSRRQLRTVSWAS